MPASSEDLLKFLRNLRQVREFTSEPVPESAINDILEVGRWSGTGGNRQPIELLVIKDPGIREKMGNWGAKPAATAPVSFLILNKGSDNDGGRVGERLMLAAKAHGLGAAMATLKNEGPDEIKKQLGIPDDFKAIFVISVGHIDRAARAGLPKQGAAARRPMSEYAHRERY